MSSRAISLRPLTTLSHPSPSSPLLPPYSNTPDPTKPAKSLSPPYRHSNDERKKDIKSSKRYVLIEKDARYEKEWRTWIGSLIRVYGEERIIGFWENALKGVEQTRADKTPIPEIAFHNLSTHLSSSFAIEKLKRAGIVIIRDVISDQKAEYVNEEIVRATAERGGQSPFWHPYLLALRSHPSILSANAQLMQALAGVEARYIKAETVGLLPKKDFRAVTDLEDVWKSPSPLSAHLTLSTVPADTFAAIPTTSSAIYAALRPLFKPIRSRISFYNSEGYQDRKNWSIANPSTTSTKDIDELKLHHLHPGTSLPELRPGDIVYRNSSFPILRNQIEGGMKGVDSFLPVTPLSANSAELISRQKEAFEKGLPPSHVGLEGSVVLEQEGKVDELGGRSGRAVMGYE